MCNSCMTGGYSDPTQFLSISTTKEILNYYHTNKVEKDELYIYYNLFFISTYTLTSQWSILAYKTDLETSEYLSLTKEQSEKYPESLPVALEKIDQAGSEISRALFNILNKKTINELEKEATMERSDK